MLLLVTGTFRGTWFILTRSLETFTAQWTPATVPGDWELIRDRWKTFHALRTLTALACFACFGASALSGSRGRNG